MRRLLVVAGILGCGAPPHVPAPPIANQAAPPGPKLPAVPLDQAWPAQVGARLAVLAPAGPFAKLDDVCTALHREVSDSPYEGCQSRAQDALDGGGEITRIGGVSAWEPKEEYGASTPPRLEHFAIETRHGWYVLPRLGDTGNRYSSLFFEGERAGSGVLIRYTYDLATAGRFASEVEHGVIACDVVDGVVGCTPKLATWRYRARLETSQPDWPSVTEIEFACAATYDQAGVTVSPATEHDNNGEWSADAAAACTQLAYSGTHSLEFR